MALEKAIASPVGVDANYHVVSAIHFDRFPDAAPGCAVLVVNMRSYISQDVRNKPGSQPVGVSRFQFTISTPLEQSNLMVLAYDQLKTLPGFVGAADV